MKLEAIIMKHLFTIVLLSVLALPATAFFNSDTFEAKNLHLNFISPNGNLTADNLKIQNSEVNFQGNDINAEITAAQMVLL